MATSEEMDRITFGTAQSDFNIQLLDSSHHLLLEFDGIKMQSNLVGKYNFANLAAAIAMGAYFGVSSEKIKAGIEGYIPSNNRSQMITKGSNTILMDAYNANPTSMLAAVENFKQTKGENKILFLGDMFELGTESLQEHKNIISLVKDKPDVEVLFVGNDFYSNRTPKEHFTFFESFEKLEEYILTKKPVNKDILIKGSRGMALERTLDLL